MSSETFHCHLCGQTLPLINKTIHELRCRGPKPTVNPKGTIVQPIESKNNSSSNDSTPPQSQNNNVIHIDSSDDSYGAPPVNESRPGCWTCRTCTYSGNDVVSGVCEVCGAVDENMAVVAATLAEDMALEEERAIPEEFTNSHDTKSSHTTSSASARSSQEWTCSQCTMINDIKQQECSACGNIRPGQSSYRDQLIDDSYDDDFHNLHFVPPSSSSSNNNSSSSSSSSALTNYRHPLESVYGGAVFGAGLGAALAAMSDRSIADGAMTGAGVGALGGLMFDELRRNRDRVGGVRRTNMLFDDADDGFDATAVDFPTSRGSGVDVFDRRQRMMDRMMMMDPAMMMMLMNRNQLAMGGGDDIDRMTYEQLSERFQQPIRRVDERTIDALPSRIITSSNGNSSNSGSNNNNSRRGMTASDAIDLTSSSPPSKLRRMPSAGSTAAPSKEEEGCAICLAKYSPGEEVKTLPCLHCFHSECIEGWLRVNHTCPVCKFSLLQRG